jgi:hypothetical protein
MLLSVLVSVLNTALDSFVLRHLSHSECEKVFDSLDYVVKDAEFLQELCETYL